MQSTRSSDNEKDEVVVPIEKGVKLTQRETGEKLQLLIELVLKKNSRTDARLRTLEDHSGEHDRSLGELKAETASLESAETKLERQAATNESRLKVLETINGWLRDATEELHGKASALDSSIMHLRGRANVQEMRLESLESTTGDTEASVGDLRSATETLARRQGVTESRTESLARRAAELREADKRIGLQADGLRNRFKWAAWSGGGAIVVLALVAGVSHWQNAENLNSVATVLDARMVGIEQLLSARVDDQVSSLNASISGGIDENLQALKLQQPRLTGLECKHPIGHTQFQGLKILIDPT